MTEIPSWEGFMTPVLTVLSDGVVRNRRDLAQDVADALNLSGEQKEIRIASGKKLHENRMGWALSFLTNVGALSRPSRGLYTITVAGRTLLNDFPSGLRESQVRALGEDPNSQIRVYVQTTSRSANKNTVPPEETTLTPIEQVQTGIERIDGEVAEELLSRLQDKDPFFFEQAVVDLLLAMGYGGTGGAGTVTKKSNDGGIDGVIDQDVLGLSKIYVQAKRYTANTVQRQDLQAFVGALSGKADSGVFITTSKFSDGAKTYADTIPTRIILIDGAKLTDLMIRFGVGVQVSETYKVVEIDEDFFA